MIRSRYRIFETEYPYFMTCTVVGWVPVFTRSEAVEIVYDSFIVPKLRLGTHLLEAPLL